MIAELVVIAAAAGAAVWVLSPLHGDQRTSNDDASLLVQEASGRKMSALEAILDMEGERAAGKLSQEDFEVLRSQYEIEAVRALRDLEALARPEAGHLDRSIEEEVARLRADMTCSRCGGLKTGETCDRCHESSS